MKQLTFIILHGWGLSSEKFHGLSATLQKEGHRVVVPDLPGFGSSKQPEKPLYLSDYVEFLHGFIKKQKFDKPIIIGHSFGGRVALKYQYVYPKDLKALVLTGTPGFTPVAKKKLFVVMIFAKFGKFLFSVPPFSIIQEKVRAWYYYIVGARDYYRATPVMRQTFKNIVQEDLTDYMKSIRIPCGLYWGQDDIITPVWIAKRMTTIIHGANVVIIPDADHGVSYKKPEVFVDALRSFLKVL
jgi:pimeloyl-ACP methyl ester carboxylesterase